MLWPLWFSGWGGETKTTVRIAGRSAGDSTLRIVATPQIALPLLASSDDFPVKLFSLDSVASFMVLREVINVDAGGGSTDKLLDALTVGGVVVARETFTRDWRGYGHDIHSHPAHPDGEITNAAGCP